MNKMTSVAKPKAGGARIEIARGQFERVADFVLAENPAIPPATLAVAARLLTDTLAVTAGASVLDVSRIVRNHAVRHLASGGGEPGARILFDGRRASLPGAAYSAASQTDNLDAHDGYPPTKGHIGCAVIPALFAIAETRPQLTAREAIQAVAIAYEVSARAGIALHASVDDYHTSGAWNALGVAALFCRLRGSSPAVLREALGIAEYHGPRSQMMREIDHPTMLHDGSGMGALTGLQAGLLAEDGFEGAPAITVEAAEAALFWADLGSVWTTDLNYIKPYPICRWAHAAIDALRAVMLGHRIGPDHIASIEVRTFYEASRLFDGMPQTTSQAQYSLKFALATMLLHGRIGAEHIGGDALSDPRIAALVDRITVTEEDRHNARFPQSRWSDIVVMLRDGRRLESGDTPARGGPEAPMDEAEFTEKFHAMVAPVLDDGRASRILSRGVALADSDDAFSAFAELCYPPGSAGT